MKGRVLSVRVSHDILVNCYEIVKLCGVRAEGMPMGTAVANALEKVIFALRAEGKLKAYNEQEVDDALSQFMSPEKWTGYELKNMSVDLAKIPIDEKKKERFKSVIDGYIDKIQTAEQEDLKQLMMSLPEDSPEAYIACHQNEKKNLPPWECSELISERQVEHDERYQAEQDEIKRYAIRAVYSALSVEDWPSTKADRMIETIYQTFNSWRKE